MRLAAKGEEKTTFYDSTRGKKEEQYFLLKKRKKNKTHYFKWGLYWQEVGECRKIGI